MDLFVKNIITSVHWFHLNNYTPYENKCFKSKKPNSLFGVRYTRKFRLRTDASRETQCSHMLNVRGIPRVIAECASHHVIVMDGRSFGRANETSCWQAKSRPPTKNYWSNVGVNCCMTFITCVTYQILLLTSAVLLWSFMCIDPMAERGGRASRGGPPPRDDYGKRTDNNGK